jgi:hypothetical protein
VKKTVNARVWLCNPNSDGEALYDFQNCDMSKHGWYEVGVFPIKFEEPTREEIIPAVVEGLRKGLVEIRATAESRCRLVEEQIQNLLALTYDEPPKPSWPEDYIPF